MNEEQAASADIGADNEETPLDPQAALGMVGDVRKSGHRETRWLAFYFLIYGVGIALVGLLIGASGGRLVSFAMGGWAILVVCTVVWANRKRAVIRHVGALMAVWVVCFCLTWGPTVIIGSIYFPRAMAWWIWCGIGIVVVHLVLAGYVWRKSARQ